MRSPAVGQTKGLAVQALRRARKPLAEQLAVVLELRTEDQPGDTGDVAVTVEGCAAAADPSCVDEDVAVGEHDDFARGVGEAGVARARQSGAAVLDETQPPF